MRSISRYAAACALTLATLTGAASAASAASGSGGGGGGGGGTGGGGGGTTTTATNGAIRPVSAAPVCDAGSTMTVTLDKGFDKRVEAVMDLFVQTGRWEFHIDNVTTGKPVLGFATSLGPVSTRITILGGAVPVGTSELHFVATRRDFGSLLEPTSPLAPLAETCTATMFVTGR